MNAEVSVFDVPGAFGLPLLAQKPAETGAQSIVSGLMDVGLKTGVPVLSVSLRLHHFQPTEDHIGFFTEHFVKKGREAADAALEVVRLHERLVGLVAQAVA